MLNDLWTAVGNFFAQIPTWASNIWNNNIVPFVTQTLPQMLNDLWTSVGTFISETLPNLGQAIKDGFNNFVSSVGEKISGFFSGIVQSIGNIGSKIMGSAGKGYASATGSTKIPAYAAGGFTNGISIAGEAGTEAVISFDPAYRSANIQTWQAAGRMLGVDEGVEAKSFGAAPAGGGQAVGTFISETLPNLGQAIKDGFNNFVSSVGEKISGFFSGIVQSIGNIGSKIMGSAGKGYASATGSTKIPAYAAGGFTNGISIAGEAGTEAVISFDPAYRSANIQTWQAAGRMLGVDEGVEAKSFGAAPAGGGQAAARESNPTFVFSPNITIQGSASREDVSAALRDGYEQFKTWVARYERERRRTAY